MAGSTDNQKLRIGLITCDPLPEPDHDEAPTLEAFAREGHHAETVPWNGEGGGDLSRFDACLIRATWDYYHQIDRFLAWAETAATQTRLFNPPEVVRWNCHKGYLLELERAGIDIVPTALIRTGESLNVKELSDQRGWRAGVVVKPAIGAGSWKALRFAAEDLDDAQTFADEVAVERDVVIQPVASGFAHPGERSLMWIDGRWTHAIRKKTRYAGEEESVDDDIPVTEEEQILGDRVLETVGDDLLYARLDVVQGNPSTGDEGDELLVSELELIEPSMFFFCDGGEEAAKQLVSATERAVRAFSNSSLE